LQRFVTWAEQNRLTPLEAAARAADCPGLTRRAASSLRDFAGLIAEFSDSRLESIRMLLDRILERTGYLRAFKEGNSTQDQERVANVEELVNAAAQYDGIAEGNPTLEGFLETTALVADVDSVDGTANQVTLMTLHSAKGLEFPVVYIVGVEQTLLPHERSLRTDDPGEYEEERRLLFVGMTRARERLYLTRTHNRETRGRSLASIPSEFLREIGVSETVVPLSNATGMPHAEVDDDVHLEINYDDVSQESPDDLHSVGGRPSGRRADSISTSSSFANRPRLFSGADLLARAAARAAELPAGFAVGMSVRHPQYGVGRIVKIGGFAKNRTITVEFDDDGRSETFVNGKNPLQPVGAG
jgi:DNA helicase-2/ATP-dependent DNA helicase PcrA